MNEDTENATAVEEAENDVEQEVSVKKPTKNEAKERPTQKAERKDVGQDNYRSDPNDELKREAIERRIENKELKQRLEKLTSQFETARSEFEESKKIQTNRVIRATLLSSLNKANCVDPETAMSMLSDQVKFDKNGDPENHESLVDSLKKTKSYFFTGPGTSSTQIAPKAATTRGGDVRNMDDNEFAKVLKNMGVKTR